MTIEPRRKQEMMREAVERAYGKDGRYLRSVQKALDDGFGIFAINPPAQRWAAFEAMTWPQDKVWLLTEDYLELWRAGLLPDLHALTAWQEAGRPMPDPATGLPIPAPPVTDIRPFFWAWLLPPNLPVMVFKHYQADYIALTKSQKTLAWIMPPNHYQNYVALAGAQAA